jgi:hypothetical protein
LFGDSNFFMYKQITEETFYTLTGALVVFVLLEIIWPGIVLAYININWVLILWLINGMLLLSFAGGKSLKMD